MDSERLALILSPLIKRAYADDTLQVKPSESMLDKDGHHMIVIDMPSGEVIVERCFWRAHFNRYYPV
jgi:hypothetical protein